MNEANEHAKEVFDSKELGLPLPRLQLTWIKTGDETYLVRYDMLIPVGKYDIRNEAFESGFCIAPISSTKVTSSSGPIRCGKVDKPFRDGAHANWDSDRLGIPAFAVYEDEYVKCERYDWSKDREIVR
jgi:hypothetical protein